MRVALPLFVGLACFLLIMPIAIVVVLGFSGGTFLRFPPESLSLRWFAAFLGDEQWRAALWSSLAIGLIACVVATSVGFFAAYALVRGAFPAKKLILSLSLLPIVSPTVVTAIAMYYASAQLKLVGNVVWVGLCHAVIAFPVVLLILLSALQSVDPGLERAALSLGASRARTLRTVVVPIAAPGIVSAALFAFLTSFDELVISLFLTNAASQTLPVRIWNSLHLQVEPTIAAVSTFLIGVTGLVLAADALLRRRRGV
ncbi:ABC transporter permease [Methylobacterium sp. ID0610]|uniref:ABC transporter permease n=1 Tax=Methylobacterium carpenticola TaxID=3344827 RepID=UPI0036C66359